MKTGERTRRYNFSKLRLSSPIRIGPLSASKNDVEQTPSSDPKRSKLNPFQILNWIAVAGHGISALVMIILLVIYGSITIPYTQSFLKWTCINKCDDSEYINGIRKINGVPVYNKENDTILRDCTSLSPPGRPLTTSTNGKFCIYPTTAGIPSDCTGDDCEGLDLGWLVISFHLLSFFFQGLAGATDYFPILGYEYAEMIKESKNPLRFLEYGISAAIMLMCIALLNGVTDINLIVSIAVLTCACEFCGMVVEYLDTASPLKFVLHANGWLQFGCAYGIIFHAYNSAATAVDGIRPPDFVWAIVISLFLLYASFGFVQMTELFCELSCCDTCPFTVCSRNDDEEIEPDKLFPKVRIKGRCNPIYKEIVFVTLSLGAKLVLGWLIFANVLIVAR